LAFGRKVSDEFTVPLCRLHHRELHRSRNEPLWWKTARIDPIRIARGLWEATRPKSAPQPATGVKLAASGALPASPAATDDAPPKRRKKRSGRGEGGVQKSSPRRGGRRGRGRGPRTSARKNGGDPPQRAQEHRPKDRNGKTAVPAERPPARIHRRDRPRATG